MRNNNTRPKLLIRAQTPQEELDDLRIILENMPFFKEYGYTVETPNHPEFLKLVQISPDFREVNKKYIEKIFFEQCYDKDFYDAGIMALKIEKPLIEKIFPTLIDFNKKWNFKIFSQYTIALTRYGTGGMYDSESGKIVIMTTKDGKFKRFHPAPTPIHEIIHIGIEENIVKRFNLNHIEKERLVDLIVLKKFGDISPGYQLQPLGNSRLLNKHITEESLNDLPLAIEKRKDTYK